ncbi:MAG: poly(3-hydroxyalkanoate) depolymerase [Candidatus Nanopelagicales bacterium]
MARALRVPPLRETKQLELTVDGQQFRVVHDVGDGTGTPLLLMNGIGAKLELLQPFVDLLSPQRDIIRFDVPGVGGSPTARHPYRLKGLARKITGILKQLGFEKADVLGISWGGGLAQQFAYSESAHCRKLVLVSTATGSIMVPAHPKILAKMITHRRYTDPDYLESVAHEIYGGTMRHNPTAALTALRQQSTSHNGAGYVMQLTAGLGWTSVPFLPRVKAPTLVMSGNDDPLIPSCNARIIAGLIPNSELNIFEGGHLALVTEADVHAPEVEAFLDRIGD